MANTYDENTDITLSNSRQLISINERDEEKIAYDNNDRKSAVYFTSSSEENLSEPQTKRMLVDPNEWKINDSRSGKLRAPRQNEFVLLLLAKERYSSYVSWIDEDQGLCRVHQPENVAALWNKVKKRCTTGLMDYDTFARGIRIYYKSGLMLKTYRKHTLCFRLPVTTVSN